MEQNQKKKSQPIKEGKENKGGHHKYRPKTERPETTPPKQS